jgi:hypothetical protein
MYLITAGDKLIPALSSSQGTTAALCHSPLRDARLPRKVTWSRVVTMMWATHPPKDERQHRTEDRFRNLARFTPMYPQSMLR